MKRSIIRIWVCSTMIIFLCMTATMALADDPIVIINKVELTALAPYWVNGGTTALSAEPVGGYNAYLDVANSSLILKNADIDTFNSSGKGDCAIETYIDLTIFLAGTNTIAYTGTGYDKLYGIYGFRDISLEGTGSLDIQFSNTGPKGGSFGIFNTMGSLTIADCGAVD